MQLTEFINNLYSTKGNYGKVVSVTTYYDKEIVLNESGDYFVDGQLIEQKLSDLDEVKQYIDIQEDAFKAKETIYEDLSENTIASIIKKHTDVKVTRQLIESYVNIASSRSFTIDPIVLEMRTNRYDSSINGKIVFKLDDGKQVAISEQTAKKISELLNRLDEKEDVLSYMRAGQQNFMSVLKLI